VVVTAGRWFGGAVDPVTLQVSLRPVVRDGRLQVEGEIESPRQEPARFEGWMELLGLLEQAVSAPASPST